MNISIDWPRGRRNTQYFLNETCESFCDSDDNNGSDGESPVAYPTPADLAQSRKRDWPIVNPMLEQCELFQIYSQVRDSGLPNMQGCRIPVPSMLDIAAWKAVATGHHDDKYVLDGIQFGFPLHYTGPPLLRENRDAHSSARQHWSHVQRYVHTEVQNKALLGPFGVPPFIPWTNISPIMTRPKADS